MHMHPKILFKPHVALELGLTFVLAWSDPEKHEKFAQSNFNIFFLAEDFFWLLQRKLHIKLRNLQRFEKMYTNRSVV
jgi:hypothetical protein